LATAQRRSDLPLRTASQAPLVRTLHGGAESGIPVVIQVKVTVVEGERRIFGETEERAEIRSFTNRNAFPHCFDSEGVLLALSMASF
jgi:hypothetical protein